MSTVVSNWASSSPTSVRFVSFGLAVSKNHSSQAIHPSAAFSVVRSAWFLFSPPHPATRLTNPTNSRRSFLLVQSLPRCVFAMKNLLLWAMRRGPPGRGVASGLRFPPPLPLFRSLDDRILSTPILMCTDSSFPSVLYSMNPSFPAGCAGPPLFFPSLRGATRRGPGWVIWVLSFRKRCLVWMNIVYFLPARAAASIASGLLLPYYVLGCASFGPLPPPHLFRCQWIGSILFFVLLLLLNLSSLLPRASPHRIDW